MQDYMSLRIDATPCDEDITDLLAAFLGDLGYESFVPDEKGLTAYIKDTLYNKGDIVNLLAEFPIETELTAMAEFVKGQDWNDEWEKNYFKPIIVAGECVVHSSFHKDIPEAKYDIVIDPKMAFGTGHHSTTGNMMRLILSSDLQGKTVTDMGTGTGILAILCKMRGAKDVIGIEIDPFACENAIENVSLNGVDIKMICGDASNLDGLRKCDLFMANINRNIITNDIKAYADNLKEGGEMFLSGFYLEDVPIVCKEAEKHGLKKTEEIIDNNWTAIRLVKTNAIN